jgi:predicted negative regulator of RcsB-dependent stress response
MAHRPSKKKVKDPITGAEPGQNPDVDERNLIDTAESVSLSFEDRIRIYWDENRAFIIGSIIVLIAIIVGYQGLVAFQNSRERAVRNELATLTDDRDERIAFVERRANTPQGGFIALAIADEYFEDGEYADAAVFYQKAIDALGDNPLAGRAHLGRAISALRAGDTEQGRAMLEKIADNRNLPQATRAEAVFHLAIIALNNGDNSQLEARAAQLDGMPYAQIWQARLAEIR